MKCKLYFSLFLSSLLYLLPLSIYAQQISGKHFNLQEKASTPQGYHQPPGQIKAQEPVVHNNSMVEHDPSLLINAKGCATVEVDAWRRTQNPDLPSMAEFEVWMEQKITEMKANSSSQKMAAVVTIPVVVHVIHNNNAVGSGDNISQAQINSQITVLNQDFRKLFGTPGYNTNPVGADSEIEWCLATEDPNGVALTEPGIHRVNRVTAGFSSPSYSTNYVDNTIKPATSWDPTRYCNIWVVDIGNFLLGYAQFPSSSGLQGMPANGGAANTDGVVMNYWAFGNTGNVQAPFDGGRTTTHELGHWLGLRHIWGDSNCGTDYCADTPTQQGSSSGCPNTTTCDGQNDQVENYMDYSDDACMNIFTIDQKARFNAVLANSPRRGSLTTSTVCGSTPPPCNPPANLAASNIAATSATVSWSAVTGAASYNCRIKETSAANWQDFPTTNTSINFTGMANCTAYEVQVQAYCSGDSSGYTASTTFSTVGCGGGGVSCDTISNVDAGDSPVVYTSSTGGYVAGHNNYSDIAKHDEFTYTGTGTDLDGAYFAIARAYAGNANSMVTFTARDATGAGGSPGPIFASTTVAISTLTEGAYNYISFGGAQIPLNGQFFVGVQLDYTNNDTIALFTSTDGDIVPGTAWEQWSNGTWYNYNSTSAWGLDVAHLIDPVICSGEACLKDSYEPNDIDASAMLIYNGFNSTHNARICPTGDIDFYRFVADAAKPRTSIRLNLLPANYNLQLFDANLNLVAQSANAGTAAEVINRNNLIGGALYYIRVSGVNGAFDPDDEYSLSLVMKAPIVGSGTKNPVSQQGGFSGLKSNVSAGFDLYPNPTDQLLNIIPNRISGQVQLNLLDLTGKQIASRSYDTEQGQALQLDTRPFANGTYLVELRNGDFRETHKIVILH